MRLVLLLDVELDDTDALQLTKEEREDVEYDIADALSGVDAEEALKDAAETSGYAVGDITVLDFYKAHGSGKGLKDLRKMKRVPR